MRATPEMIAAGADAARKYMEETGGNSPAVIWDAMWAAQPQRQPLTEAEYMKVLGPLRDEMICSAGTLRRVVRALESAIRDKP